MSLLGEEPDIEQTVHSLHPGAAAAFPASPPFWRTKAWECHCACGDLVREECGAVLVAVARGVHVLLYVIHVG